jgi:hypothetical protein
LLFRALFHVLTLLRLFLLLRDNESAEAFLDLFIMNKGNNLEEVNFAENFLKDEAQIGLGLD